MPSGEGFGRTIPSPPPPGTLGINWKKVIILPPQQLAWPTFRWQWILTKHLATKSPMKWTSHFVTFIVIMIMNSPPCCRWIHLIALLLLWFQLSGYQLISKAWSLFWTPMFQTKTCWTSMMSCTRKIMVPWVWASIARTWHVLLLSSPRSLVWAITTLLAALLMEKKVITCARNMSNKSLLGCFITSIRVINVARQWFLWIFVLSPSWMEIWSATIVMIGGTTLKWIIGPTGIHVTMNKNSLAIFYQKAFICWGSYC